MNKDQRPIEIGDLTLDIGNHRLTRDGANIELPGLSFRLLEELARHWPGTASRRDLIKALWGNIVVSDDTLRQRVRLLRRSLGKKDYVAAVKGVGYRLAAPSRQSGWRLRRRSYYVAATILLVGLFSVQMLTGYSKHETTHAVKHALRH